MAGRIGASISSGARLGQLMIARDLGEYEDIAVRLAECEACLKGVRELLVSSRNNSVLFDTGGWVRSWERGLKMAWESDHHVVVASHSREVRGHAVKLEVGGDADLNLSQDDGLERVPGVGRGERGRGGGGGEEGEGEYYI